MKRSPLASSRHADSPPKPRKFEVRISPLRYSSDPKRVRERSRGSKAGIGRALTSIETGALTKDSSANACFGGGCVASCARAMAGIAIAETPAAVDVRKRRREISKDICLEGRCLEACATGSVPPLPSNSGLPESGGRGELCLQRLLIPI